MLETLRELQPKLRSNFQNILCHSSPLCSFYPKNVYKNKTCSLRADPDGCKKCVSPDQIFSIKFFPSVISFVSPTLRGLLFMVDKLLLPKIQCNPDKEGYVVRQTWPRSDHNLKEGRGRFTFPLMNYDSTRSYSAALLII